MTELTTAPSGIHADAGLVTIDVRPILERNTENGWERTERIRTSLYHLLEVLCMKRGIEALVLQSMMTRYAAPSPRGASRTTSVLPEPPSHSALKPWSARRLDGQTPHPRH